MQDSLFELRGQHVQNWHCSLFVRFRLFASAGLLTARKHGNRVYYRADRTSPACPALYEVLVKTAGIVDVIRAALAPLTKKIAVSFIYGSVAAGKELSASDVDLMVVGRVTFSEVTLALREADQTIGREINPSVYPIEEFRKKIEGKAHFVSAVIKTPLLFVYGTRAWSSSDYVRRAETRARPP